MTGKIERNVDHKYIYFNLELADISMCAIRYRFCMQQVNVKLFCSHVLIRTLYCRLANQSLM